MSLEPKEMQALIVLLCLVFAGLYLFVSVIIWMFE